MIHPHTELRHISDDIGLGVIATRLIPRGTITWVLDALDLVIDPEALAALPAAQRAYLERHASIDPRGRRVLCWDAGRYVNHGCAATTARLGTICDLAVRDILPGEALTRVRSEDLRALAPAIDALLAQAVVDVPAVEQPLWPAMRADDRARLTAVTSGAAAVPSCLDLGAPAPERLRARAVRA